MTDKTMSIENGHISVFLTEPTYPLSLMQEAQRKIVLGARTMKYNVYIDVCVEGGPLIILSGEQTSARIDLNAKQNQIVIRMVGEGQHTVSRTYDYTKAYGDKSQWLVEVWDFIRGY